MGITGSLKRDIEKRIGGAKKPSKYKNVRTTVDGIAFASRKEADCYVKLKALERSGVISELTLQPSFPIIVNDVLVCRYVADFRYRDESGEVVVCDCKGFKTDVYRLKKKLMLAVFCIDVVEL